MSVFWAIVLLTAAMLGWLTNLFNLPGNWLVLLFAAVYAYFVPPEWQTAISGWTVLGLAALAVIGELIELVAGAYGAAKVGGSRRGAVLAALLSVVGGLTGAVVGVPIPIFGPIVGALLFAGLGAWAGAVLGEYWKGKRHGDAWKVGRAAFWGRLFGTLAKTWVGAVMLIVIAVALVL